MVQQSNQHFALLSLSYAIAFTTGETLMLSLAFWFSSPYHCLKVLLMQCRAVLQSYRCTPLNAFILLVTILRDHTFRLTASLRKCLKSIQTFWSRRFLRFWANKTILRKDGISNDCILSQLYNLPQTLPYCDVIFYLVGMKLVLSLNKTTAVPPNE